MSKKSLIAQGDALFAAYFHDLYNQCAVEGCNNPCELAHLIPRGHHLFRWDRRNVLPLCGWHHKYSLILSCHGSPEAFQEWLKQNHPAKYIFWADHKNQVGYSIPEYWYREQIEAMKKW